MEPKKEKRKWSQRKRKENGAKDRRIPIQIDEERRIPTEIDKERRIPIEIDKERRIPSERQCVEGSGTRRFLGR